MRMLIAGLLALSSMVNVNVEYLKDRPLGFLWGNPEYIRWDDTNHTWVNGNYQLEFWWRDLHRVLDYEERKRLADMMLVPVEKRYTITLAAFYRDPDRMSLAFAGAALATGDRRDKLCGAPWCNAPTASAAGQARRAIGGVEVCRNCYQYVWTEAKAADEKMADIFLTLDPPKRPLPRLDTVCAREGCGEFLPTGGGPKVRRTIGLHHVCRNCYETAWELGKEKGLTLEAALDELWPKGQKPRETLYKEVTCALPWCEYSVENRAEHAIAEGAYACGNCRAYLNVIAKRYEHTGKSWQAWGVEAAHGNVIPPGGHEPCAMPWCNRVGHMAHRGPKGEAVCATDAMYLRMYGQRNGLTFDEAFAVAPPPLRRGNLRT